MALSLSPPTGTFFSGRKRTGLQVRRHRALSAPHAYLGHYDSPSAGNVIFGVSFPFSVASSPSFGQWDHVLRSRWVLHTDLISVCPTIVRGLDPTMALEHRWDVAIPSWNRNQRRYIVKRIDKQNSNKAMQKMEMWDRKTTNPYESLIENSCVMLPRSSRTVLWDDFSVASASKINVQQGWDLCGSLFDDLVPSQKGCPVNIK